MLLTDKLGSPDPKFPEKSDWEKKTSDPQHCRKDKLQKRISGELGLSCLRKVPLIAYATYGPLMDLNLVPLVNYDKTTHRASICILFA